MLFGILRAPLKFFDKTPTGRVLARFSKDIEVLDTALPEHISTFIYCFYEVIEGGGSFFKSLVSFTGLIHLCHFTTKMFFTKRFKHTRTTL